MRRGRGEPRRHADPEQAAPPVSVVLVVVMLVTMGVLAPVAQATAENGGPDADDEEARDERQPGVEPLGHDEP